MIFTGYGVLSMATATARRSRTTATNKFRVYIPGLDKGPLAAPICIVEALPDGETCRVTWELPQPHFWPDGGESGLIREGVTVAGGPGKGGAIQAYNLANGINSSDRPHVVTAAGEVEAKDETDSFESVQ